MTSDDSSQELQSAKRKHDDTTQAVGKRAKNHSRANP